MRRSHDARHWGTSALPITTSFKRYPWLIYNLCFVGSCANRGRHYFFFLFRSFTILLSTIFISINLQEFLIKVCAKKWFLEIELTSEMHAVLYSVVYYKWTIYAKYFSFNIGSSSVNIKTYKNYMAFRVYWQIFNFWRDGQMDGYCQIQTYLILKQNSSPLESVKNIFNDRAKTCLHRSQLPRYQTIEFINSKLIAFVSTS